MGWIMQRELATENRDLPHAVVGDGKQCTYCLRAWDHEIHHFQPEQASHREVLQTEKGT